MIDELLKAGYQLKDPREHILGIVEVKPDSAIIVTERRVYQAVLRSDGDFLVHPIALIQ